MSPWLGRLGDYSPQYDVKFDLPFFTIEVKMMIWAKIDIARHLATFIQHASPPHVSSLMPPFTVQLISHLFTVEPL